jgi:glycine/D-amino acid oxidase-like deaminating enzyme
LPERKSYDCVVVGAGSFGAWTALRLRQAGRSVALVDARGAGNPLSSSGGASRLIRMGYGSDEIYTRWAMRSLEAWRELFARVGRPELFQPTGVLWTARSGHPHARHSLAILEKLKLPHESLSPSEMRRRYPQLHCSGDVIAILEPGSGVLLAHRAVRAVAQEAERRGVEILSAQVTPAMPPFAAGETIFACGPWLPKLFPEVVGSRIQVTRQPVFYFDAPASAMPAWIDFSDPRGAYSVPPLDGQGFKLALDRHGPAFDPDTGSREATAAETAEASAFLRERFPALAGAPLVRAEVCQYESTCTGDFLIDRHPELPHVWLVGGGSGHGFKHGPAVGEYVARMLDGAAADPRFSWQSKTAAFSRTVY